MKWKLRLIKNTNPEIHRYYKINNIEYPEFKCACCGIKFDSSAKEYRYCPYCGRSIDWSNIVDISPDLVGMIDGI